MPIIKVSVIVPIYNVEKYLSTCIDSIQNQSLQDIEIILVNDGSPDNSGVIADEYAKHDKRIKVIHKINGGLSSARNAGIQIAQGEYLSFIDSDDWIEKEMMEKMYLEAKKHNSDVVISGMVVEYPKEDRKVIDNIEETEKAINTELGEFFWKLHKYKLSNYACNKIYKRSVISSNNLLFIDDAMPAEDLFFNLSFFKKATSALVLDEAFYHYMRRDEHSILSSYQKDLIKVETQRRKAYKEFFEHFKMEVDEYSAYLNGLTVGAATGIVQNLYKKDASFNRKERTSIIRENVFDNNILKFEMPAYVAKTAYSKIFVFLYKYTNPVLMEFVYSFLFYLRRNFVYTYNKFRAKELK